MTPDTRTCHSTETALLRVHYDITVVLGNNCHAVLVIPNLSAAFDVSDHSILLRQLEHTLVITVAELSWIKSYLNDSNMCIAIEDVTSDTKAVVDRRAPGFGIGIKLVLHVYQTHR